MNWDDSWPPHVVRVPPPRRSGRAPSWLALVVVLAGAAACTRGAGQPGTGAARSAAPIAVPKVPVGSALAVPAAGAAAGGGAAGTLPSAGPLVTLTIDGVRRQIQQAAGRVLLVHAWATWCAPCLYELPEFDRIAAKASARGARVLALAVDTEYGDIARVATVLRERAPHLAPVIVDYGGKNEFFRLFSIDWSGSIPATFVFDRSGKLQAQFLNVGEFQGMNAALDRLLGPG